MNISLLNSHPPQMGSYRTKGCFSKEKQQEKVFQREQHPERQEDTQHCVRQLVNCGCLTEGSPRHLCEMLSMCRKPSQERQTGANISGLERPKGSGWVGPSIEANPPFWIFRGSTLPPELSVSWVAGVGELPSVPCAL